MFELKLTTFFSAAHSLRNYKGQCEHNHGHNWEVEVVVSSSDLNDQGMVMDFKELRELLEGVIESFDHKCLNDIKPFDEVNPTTENISREIYKQLASILPSGMKVARVTSYETRGAGATYYEE